MKYLLLTLVLFSCSKEDRSLEIYYMKHNSMTAMRIPCHMIGSKSIDAKNIKIDNEQFLDEFASLYNRLEEAKETRSLNARIKIIYRHDMRSDTICMGEYFTIEVNGQQKEDSPELLKLIKDKIYKK